MISNYFHKTALGIQKFFMGFDSYMERCGNGESAPPVFIVGAPRSGSTVLMQSLTRMYDVGYISNMMALMPKYMLRIAKLDKKNILAPKELVESEYGYISGLSSPNEAGKVMRFWFDSEPDRKKESIRRTVSCLHKIFGTDIIIKNLYNSLRLKTIASVFPEARIIYLKRDPLYTAQSIYIGRMKYREDMSEWFSVEPEGHESVLHMSPEYQVAWQVLKIESAIESCLGLFKNPIIMNYEDLSIKAIEDTGKQLNLRRRPVFTANELSMRNSVKLPEKIWEKLKNEINNAENDTGASE